MHRLLTVEGLTKVFPGQVALDAIDITLWAGRTRALVGQNGSGKSTLIKILAGFHRPTSVARASFHGSSGEAPLQLGSAKAAHRAGIRFVHQDLGLVDSLSAVENIALGSGYSTRRGRIDWALETRRARADLAELGVDVPVAAPVGGLPASQRTMVALARAMRDWEGHANLLVLDESTTSLPHDDVEQLFDAIRRLQRRGVAILYVSHHIDEVFAIADDVTVLRDGRVVTTEPLAALDRDRVIDLMIGHRVETRRREITTSTAPPLLALMNLAGDNVRSVTLTVGAGEVVGVAGITGSGREHLIPIIVGQRHAAGGRVTIDGTEIDPGSPRDVLAAGGAFVTADRTRLGNLPGMSVVANTTICDVTRNTARGRLVHRRERREVARWIDRLGTKAASPTAPMATLSGGNQQKVLFSRALRLEPVVLLLDEPTSGIDVGAKEEIHSLIDDAAANGAAVLIASSDADELVRLSHRVLVMRNGTVVAQLLGEDITTTNIQRALLASDAPSTIGAT